MSDDTSDVSQLRIQLKDYILDSEAEIRSNLKLGLWRGQNDPIVVKMQKVVDDLIARVREDDEDKFLWKYSAAEQRGYSAGERAGYAAALKDIHAEVQDMPPVLGPAIHGIGTVLVARDRVLTAIEVLRGER